MAAESQLNPTQPVNQQIYRILRRDIVHCLIPPGTPLSEKEVSVRFAVSRQPVREAFIKLAENGLIQIRPQRGSYVNKISLSQVRNGCFVRQAIECAVVRRAAGMINDEQVYQLEQNLQSPARQAGCRCYVPVADTGSTLRPASPVQSLYASG